MDADNLKEMHGNIYTAKVNAVTPWACIQRPARWVGGDPNPGTAFRVYENGTYEVLRGYHYYKQVSRIGQPGMAVARTFAMDSEVAVIAFARNDTKHPDAFLVVNIGADEKRVAVRVLGTDSSAFGAWRTTDAKDRYERIGRFTPEDGTIVCEAPARSATTFVAE